MTVTAIVTVGAGLQVSFKNEVHGKMIVLVVMRHEEVGVAVVDFVVEETAVVEDGVVVVEGAVEKGVVVVVVVEVEEMVLEEVLLREVVLEIEELPPPPPQLPTAEIWSLMSVTAPDRAYKPPWVATLSKTEMEA